MDQRISQSFLRERGGKMPKHTFDRMVSTGLLPPPDGDGKWSATVVPRFDAAVALRSRARALDRRVLLLHQEGFLPTLAARRAAARSVVGTIRPAARRMTRVRRELDALAERARLSGPRLRRPRTYALPLAREHWTTVLDAPDDDLWQREWELAARYAVMLPSIARAAGLPEVEIPDEERIVLALVDQLLRHPEIRAQVPLSAPVPRVPEVITRPGTGRYRRTDAPDFDETRPPPDDDG